ncbi:cupredoxin domain-containing protein [Paracoccus aminophilus]|uniref:Iron permease n=1 Tax=Paracoccus aminophilus JCM 7686 TaxID=1367847 RepID=S5Y9S0_PARAH|nr:cupredoxin domain-containing protein [Paracoccus aminophilus]AGT08093.1 iron permease [Paracoccus aminophilus JCM 7686]
MSAPEAPIATSAVPRILLPVSAVLFAVSLTAFISALALAERGTRPAEGTVEIRVTETVCDPMELSVPAGRRIFRIHNAATSRPLEWEILDGVMVVAERENIAPGFSADVAARLVPGEYQITCGLLSSPRGKLTVTATDQSLAEQKRPPVRVLIAPLSEYKVRLMMASGRLEKTTAKLAAAMAADDQAEARTLYAEARGYWIQLEPVASRFADLKERIDPQATYLAKGEDDPAFTGFHRIEASLWGERPDGAAAASALASAAAELNGRIKTLEPVPSDITGLAANYAQHVADAVIPEGQSPKNEQDSAELKQRLDTMKAAAALLEPLLSVGHPDQQQALDAEFATLAGQIEALPADYRQVSADSRKALAAAFAKLGTALAQVNQSMGLDE